MNANNTTLITTEHGLNITMVRDAHVKVEQVETDDKGRGKALITLDTGHMHLFDKDSRVSKGLQMHTTGEIEQRLSGGTYFLVNDRLVDFRDGQYRGFVQTDEAIANLANIVGIQDTHQNKVPRFHRTTANSQIDYKYSLSGQWSNTEIVVPEYNDGGRFDSQLYYVWSPFSRNVDSALMLVRLICTNGMVGITDFVSTSVPVMNLWHENLNIASAQIQNKVNDIVGRRMIEMAMERASVGCLSRVANHARNRLEHGNYEERARDALRRIVQIAAPEYHLHAHYKDGTFGNSKVTNQIPAHLTVFDAWNLITEMRSHSQETRDSTNYALDMEANRLVFDRDGSSRRAVLLDAAPRLSPFSNPEQAFFGFDEEEEEEEY